MPSNTLFTRILITIEPDFESRFIAPAIIKVFESCLSNKVYLNTRFRQESYAKDLAEAKLKRNALHKIAYKEMKQNKNQNIKQIKQDTDSKEISKTQKENAFQDSYNSWKQKSKSIKKEFAESAKRDVDFLSTKDIVVYTICNTEFEYDRVQTHARNILGFRNVHFSEKVKPDLIIVLSNLRGISNKWILNHQNTIVVNNTLEIHSFQKVFSPDTLLTKKDVPEIKGNVTSEVPEIHQTFLRSIPKPDSAYFKEKMEMSQKRFLSKKNKMNSSRPSSQLIPFKDFLRIDRNYIQRTLRTD